LNALSHPLILALGWALIHFLWQGALIAALSFLAQAALRKGSAQSRYTAACLAMLLMTLCPLATFSYLTNREKTALKPAPVMITSVREASVTSAMDLAPAVAIPRPIQVETSPEEFAARIQRHLPWIVSGWLGAVCVLSLRLLLGYARVRQIKRRACESLGVYWTERLSDLSERLRVSRPVRLCQSALVTVPTVIGWLRPVILFPASALAGLPPAQLEAILAHELAHIQRHDYLVNLLQNLIETLLFYHPAVWWVSRHIDQERELCCDDLTVEVCGDRVNYARALAALEELRSTAPGLALAAGGGSLLRRIRRLAGLPKKANRSGCWLAGAAALMLVAAVGLIGRHSLNAADAGRTRIAEDKSHAAELLQDSRSLVGMGQLDEAEAKLEEALKQEPEFKSARCYLDFVRSIRPNLEGDLKEKLSKAPPPEMGESKSRRITQNEPPPPNHALLFLRLDLAEARRVMAELDLLGILNAHRLTGDGSSIYVPGDKVHQIRTHLASKGMPRSKEVGFEIFDKPAFGMSDYVLQFNRTRALEGELARVIARIDGIESAQVKIVSRESRLLDDPQKKPSAAVFIKLQDNQTIDQQTAFAIHATPRLVLKNSFRKLSRTS